ncbi:MAG: hypothetical protein ACOYON_10230 [Fimbriimonas sp.]
MRSLVALGLLSVLGLQSAFAAESDSAGIRFHFGFGTSGEFKRTNNTYVSISGPEIGLEIPVTKVGPVNFSFAPSVFLGGRLSHSKDSDGDVYRFIGQGRLNLPKGSGYAVFGIGYAHSFDRAKQFDAVDGTVAKFGYGIPLRVARLKHYSPEIEASYYAASNGQLRGFFVGLSGSL